MFQTCRGTKRLGLTYDPGAAGGLAGTDTMREYHESNIPHCLNYKIKDSHQSYSGIGGTSDRAVGEITQKAQVGRLNMQWTADLIGGHGSYCPMLLGLPPLIQNRTIAIHGLNDDGDGALLFFPHPNNERDVYISELLYTDSGHYLLPTDDPGGQKRNEAYLAEKVAHTLMTAARSLLKLAKSLDPSGKRFITKSSGGDASYQATVSENSQMSGPCPDCHGRVFSDGNDRISSVVNEVSPESPELSNEGEILTGNEIGLKEIEDEFPHCKPAPQPANSFTVPPSPAVISQGVYTVKSSKCKQEVFLPVELIHPNAKLPVRKHPTDAG